MSLIAPPPDDRVYTAIAGDYPITRTDIKCFNGEAVFTRPVMDAKKYKLLPHLYRPDLPVTIWIDGNIWLRTAAQELIDRYLGEADMALFCHPWQATPDPLSTAAAARARGHLPKRRPTPDSCIV
jgi:hypothetical protein